MKYLLTLLSLCPFVIYAQDIKIPGQVLDIKNNPIENASINIVGNNSSTVTDGTGIFSLPISNNIKKGEIIILRVKKEGYKPLSKQIAVSQLIVVIKLTPIKGFKKAIAKQEVADSKSQPPSQFNLQGSTISNSAVGTNPTVNNYGPEPREVTPDILNQVTNQVKDMNTPISVYRRSNDSESALFAAKIVKKLMALGYKTVFVNGIISDPTIGGDPEIEAKRQATVGYFRESGGQFNIVIPSNN